MLLCVYKTVHGDTWQTEIEDIDQIKDGFWIDDVGDIAKPYWNRPKPFAWVPPHRVMGVTVDHGN